MLKIAYHPIYKHPLPEGHRFPMEKYDLLPRQLVYEGTCTEDHFFEPSKASDLDVLRCHTKEYFTNLKSLQIDPRAQRKTGFPLSQELVDRELIIAQGTIEGCKYALENGIAMNIAGGTHHAYADRGEGFCVFNDMAIASRLLLKEQKVHKILFVDLDVHQGNGNAHIFQAEDRVFTFSLHGAKNYPIRKEKSNLDIGVTDKIEDKPYLDIIYNTLPKLIQQVQPDIIFYQAGVDILSTDKLGRLSVSIEGCKLRDRYVLEQCKLNGIPIVISMGGGYSEKISDIIDAHANTYREAQSIFF